MLRNKGRARGHYNQQHAAHLAVVFQKRRQVRARREVVDIVVVDVLVVHDSNNVLPAVSDGMGAQGSQAGVLTRGDDAIRPRQLHAGAVEAGGKWKPERRNDFTH